MMEIEIVSVFANKLFLNRFYSTFSKWGQTENESEGQR